MAQPTTQAIIAVEPVITPVIEELATPTPATTLEKTTPMVEKKLPPNPKKAPMVILEEEKLQWSSRIRGIKHFL